MNRRERLYWRYAATRRMDRGAYRQAERWVAAEWAVKLRKRLSFEAVRSWYDSYGPSDVAPEGQRDAPSPVPRGRRWTGPVRRAPPPAAVDGVRRSSKPGRRMREIIRLGREELRRREAETTRDPQAMTTLRAQDAAYRRSNGMDVVGAPDPWAATGTGATRGAGAVVTRRMAAQGDFGGTGAAGAYTRLIGIGRTLRPPGASAP